LVSVGEVDLPEKLVFVTVAVEHAVAFDGEVAEAGGNNAICFSLTGSTETVPFSRAAS
jgi:hypothetical protein